MPLMKFFNGVDWIPLDAKDADTVDGLHAADFAPIGHVGSGGDQHAIATIDLAGFLSGPDKAKLDGILPLAEPNQNAFANVKVGTTTIVADSTSDTLELVAGSNITLTPDATNDKIIISSSGSGGSGGEMNQNAFSAIKIGATQLDADNTMDTLNLVAGTNISLTPDVDTDTITIGVSGKLGDADTLDGKHAADFATAAQVNELLKQNDSYHVYTSAQDQYGVYTIVEYRRPDNTLYMKSTLSTPDSLGNNTKNVWQIYNETGLSIVETITWTLTYDANGTIFSKVRS